jgi:hypothetical protein
MVNFHNFCTFGRHLSGDKAVANWRDGKEVDQAFFSTKFQMRLRGIFRTENLSFSCTRHTFIYLWRRDLRSMSLDCKFCCNQAQVPTFARRSILAIPETVEQRSYWQYLSRSYREFKRHDKHGAGPKALNTDILANFRNQEWKFDLAYCKPPEKLKGKATQNVSS